MKLRFALSILFCSALGTVIAQNDSIPSVWLHTGTSMVSYKGDLSGYEKYTGAFHVGIQLNRKKKLNGALNLGFGTANGENRTFTSEVPSVTPNRFLKTNFFYLNYDLHYNLVKKKWIIVYISQGLGIIRFNPKDQFEEDLQDQPETREEGETYRNAALILPTKVGAIGFLPNHFGVGIQLGFFNTLTDYLDNISQISDSGNDNLLEIRFAVYVPLKY